MCEVVVSATLPFFIQCESICGRHDCQKYEHHSQRPDKICHVLSHRFSPKLEFTSTALRFGCTKAVTPSTSWDAESSQIKVAVSR